MGQQKKSKSKPAPRKQGRDLNVLKSLKGEGVKLVEKTIHDKKKSGSPKHKKDILEPDT